MSIASQYNAAHDFLQALADTEDKNPTVRAIASRKAEEAYQQLIAARTLAYVDAGRQVKGASLA